MGSLFQSKQTTTSNATQKVDIPKSYQALMDSLYRQTTDVNTTPFKKYNEQRVADLSEREQTAFEGIDAQQGKYNPLVELAMKYASNQNLDDFMNPYTQKVIDASKERYQEDFEKQLVGARADAAGSGSFGNSRLGLVEGTLGSEFLKGSRELQYGGLRDAFDRAFANKGQSIQQLLATAGQGQQIDYNDLNALSAAGYNERSTVTQPGLDFNYQQFLEQRGDKKDKLNNTMQALQAIPRDLFTRNTASKSTQTQQESPMGVLTGLASVAASIYTGGAIPPGIGTTGASRPPTPILPPSFGSVGGPTYSGYGFGGQGAYGGNLARGYSEGGLVESYAEGGSVLEHASFRDLVPQKTQTTKTVSPSWNPNLSVTGNILQHLLGGATQAAPAEATPPPKTAGNMLKDMLAKQPEAAPTKPMPNVLHNVAKNTSKTPKAAPTVDRNQQVVDKSIDNLLRMAGVEPPVNAVETPEEEPTIFGLKYNQDLMRFGLALLASSGKNFGQALGEAGTSVLNAKEQDKDKKTKAKLLKQKELEDKVDLATKLQQFKNLDPDSQLAFQEKLLNMKTAAQERLLGKRAALRPARKGAAPKGPSPSMLKLLNDDGPAGDEARRILGMEKPVASDEEDF